MKRRSESHWRLAALIYLAMAIFALGLSLVVREGHPFEHPTPWLLLSSGQALSLSVVLGVAFTALVVATTRLFVAHFHWARSLQSELSLSIRDLGLGPLLLLALLASIAEELFFRALLEPAVGLLLSSLFFGLAHRTRSQARWAWSLWAAAVGLGLGFLFRLTGSLLGPLLAHAAVNTLNLLFLRTSSLPSPSARASLRFPG
ncbi:MAG: CPBP family intramembrane glutamic endopeptidase [Myxococcales bacterium]|nr:CPBP family intramembrane metalloprotease [Polyangiaceae bacterium]MDW8251178.1 CPBP family intramembrane glutamic endopeptidase [Myxococcales bacterium]